ncbi:hypothetical protein COV61_01160, partial [Candidatus Micrarchaeota archaeon CG11_big_fil_rev_8_21_14_0_20_47_5]
NHDALNASDNASILSSALSSCANLSIAGTSYTLSADISGWNGGTCFNVSAENITLDCQGHAASGANATNTHGVYSDKFNTTVKNCRITDFGNGIFFNYTSEGTIQNCTISTINTSATWNGIGIAIEYSNRVAITNVSTNGSRYGLGYDHSNNSVVSNTAIYSQTQNSVRALSFKAGSNNNSISNISILSRSHGVYIDGGENNTIDCQGGMINGSNQSASYGMYSSEFNATIRNCQIENYEMGVFYNRANRSSILNTTINTTHGQGYGIYICNGSEFARIENTSAYAQNKTAIYLLSDSADIIDSSGTTSASIAIYLNRVNFTNITNTNASSYTSYAFYMVYGANNTLSAVSGYSYSQTGIGISATSENNISNSNFTSYTNNAIYMQSSATRNIFSNTTATSTLNS